jgi:translation initiation factor eIF-2B subunit epsilon
MTKKKTKDSSTDAVGNDRKRHEQPLQAVVLAADWQTTTTTTTSSSLSAAAFQPLVLDQPKILCPVANQTMIDYVIHYLCNQGVQELYIVCVSYEVESYINQIIVSSSTSTSSILLQQMKIIIIRDTTISNDGDALREMEKRNVIQSDPFILIYGDCITNISLKEPIQQYQNQRSMDSSTILFMLLKPIGTTGTFASSSSLHSTLDDVVIGFNNTPATTTSTSNTTNVKRILLYDNHSNRKYVQYPCSFMNTICTEIEIRNDLYDIGIDLCSPELLIRFSDEFDYQHIRDEFVTNTVLEEEIGLQQSIYGCIVPNTSYGCRIYDLRTYHIISKDILRRYVYPTVPDNVAMITTSSSSSSACTETSSTSVSNLRYSIQKHFLYQQYESYLENNTNYSKSYTTSNTRIGRTSTVHGPGLVGYNCHIGENCNIRSCMIGKYNTIHDHCTILDTHIWDNVTIESNVTIQQSIIGNNVTIKSGVTISRGCIIGNGCIIGKNITLPEYTRLTCSTKDMYNNEFESNNNNENDDDWDTNDNNNNVDEIADISPDGIPTVTVSDDDDDDDFISDVNIVGTDGKGRVWKLSSVDDEDNNDYDDDDDDKIDIENIMKSQCIGSDLHDFYIQRQKVQKEDDHDSLSAVDDDDFGNSPDFDNDNDDADEYYYDKNVPPPSMNKVAIIGRQDGVDVVNELKLICLEYEGSDSGSSMENLGIELNSYKFSQNASYSDCTMAIIMAIIEKMNITSSMSDGKLVSEFKCMIEKWSTLLHKMCISIDEEKAIILGLERCAIDDPTSPSDNKNNLEQHKQEQHQKLSSGMSFRLLLQTLHDEEIVSDDAILAWSNERKSTQTTPTGSNNATTGNMQQQLESRRQQLYQLQPIQDFLQWLEEEDEEDDDDDEDNEDDEDDE